MKRTWGRWLVSGAIGLGMAVVPLATAEPASATPGGCYVIMTNSRNGYSNCTGGTGQHRVIVYCKNLWTWGGTTRFGPWRGINQQSWVSCPSYQVINQIYYGLQY